MIKIALAKAPNKIHLKYGRALRALGARTKFFEINPVDWQEKLKKIIPEIKAVVWHSNDKGKYYREIHDRIFFIEKIFQLPVFPNLRQYFSFNDKIKQFDIFKYLKIPQPKTFISYQKESALKFCRETKYPFILKDAHSASGLGVFLITSQSQAEKIVRKIFSPNGWNSIFSHFYAQEFIPGLEKSLRVITVGPKAIFGYWRTSEVSDWKHNAGSGRVSTEKVPAEALKISKKISRKMNYHWMSYDFITADRKLLCLESSCNFGVAGARRLGRDIRKIQMNHLLSQLKKNNK